MGARTRLSRNSRMQSQGSSGHQEGDGRRSLGRRARMTVTDMPAPHATVTQRLVAKEEKTIPGRHYVPYADIYETDDALAVVLEMPGVETKDLNIALQSGVFA